MKKLLIAAALMLSACANTGPDGVTHTATSIAEYPDGTVIESEKDAGVIVPAMVLLMLL